MQRVHVQPQHQRACAHGTRTPAGGAPRGPGRPWRVAAAPELPMPWARAVLWARRRGSSMCPDRLILYAKCAFRIWCALTCAFRICPTENHAGIPLGCALTCALKNRAYGASVPAGGERAACGLPATAALRAAGALPASPVCSGPAAAVLSLFELCSVRQLSGVFGGAGGAARGIGRVQKRVLWSDLNGRPVLSF